MINVFNEMNELVAGMKRMTVDEWKELHSSTWKAQGKALRKYRQEKGIAIHSIAQELGVSVSRLYKLERGEPVREAELLENAYLLAVDAIHERMIRKLKRRMKRTRRRTGSNSNRKRS